MYAYIYVYILHTSSEHLFCTGKWSDEYLPFHLGIRFQKLDGLKACKHSSSRYANITPAMDVRVDKACLHN